MALETLDFDLEIYVNNVESYIPLTGIASIETEIGGWKWDRKRLENSIENRSIYTTHLPVHEVNLKEGTKLGWWVSGTIEGCKYIGVDEISIRDYLAWAPVVSSGNYSLNHDVRRLYGDYSYTGSFTLDGVSNGLMFKQLRDDCIYDSINVAIWKRDSEFRIYQYIKFNYVDEFTGTLDEINNVRLDTEDDNGFLYDNIDTLKNEYTIRDNVVYLNKTKSISNTFASSSEYPILPVEDASSLFEGHGINLGTGRDVYLNYLPVARNSVRVWINSNDISLTEVSLTDKLAYSSPTDNHFEIDYDLGIITLGGYQALDCMLQASIEASDEEIPAYQEEDLLLSYPDSGVIIIGSEEIFYQERTKDNFSNCIRGYNGTTAAAHVVGSVISHRKMGTTPVGLVYVEYTAVPRIDYEVYEKHRTANGAPWVDVKPISNVNANSILQIYPGEISLDSIVLNTDTPLIGSNLYGPLYYGTDTSSLIAIAYDSKQNPVSDIPLTISIVAGSGLLNGANVSVTDYTNTEGEVYAFYNHPLVNSQLETEVTSVVHDGTDTLMTLNTTYTDFLLDDVWLFQVLKHDRAVGTTGLALLIDAGTAADMPYGLYKLDLMGVISEDFIGGLAKVVVSGITYYREITWIEQLLDANDKPFTRVYLAGTLGTVNGLTVYLLEPDAIEWNPSLVNGTRYIVYEYSNEVIHPVSGLTGAYTPLKPDEIDGNVLRFKDRLLPIPDLTDDSVNLGAYRVVIPNVVSVQANGVDPISSRVVQSNIIRLSLNLPTFLVGVDSTGVLPIPTGIKLPIEDFNAGAGIGGANFLTINPVSTNINSFVVSLEI